jgi:hypothetical protein
MRYAAGVLLLVSLCFAQHTLAFTDEEVRSNQARMRALLPSERIASWAELFLGTPYDNL